MKATLKTDSLEELREKLLADQEVRGLIEMRAYEIYVSRGGAPGGEAEDWFQAQGEIIPILINEELRGGGRLVSRPLGDMAGQPIDETLTADAYQAVSAPVTGSTAAPATKTKGEKAKKSASAGKKSPAVKKTPAPKLQTKPEAAKVSAKKAGAKSVASKTRNTASEGKKAGTLPDTDVSLKSRKAAIGASEGRSLPLEPSAAGPEPKRGGRKKSV